MSNERKGVTYWQVEKYIQSSVANSIRALSH
jgi:hypothetical protein